jgi:uncharacterized membrane protein YeiH
MKIIKITNLSSFFLIIIGFVMCLGGGGAINDMVADNEDPQLIAMHERLLNIWTYAEICFIAMFVISLCLWVYISKIKQTKT